MAETLSAREVHLWRIDLAASNIEHAHLLSDDEQARAARLKIPLARARFIAGRAALRRILGRYLDRSPGTLRFTYTSDGKPEIAAATNTGLYFNLAHSGDTALLAIARAPIGVDIEQIRPLTPSAITNVGQTSFTAFEREQLARHHSDNALTHFFRLWVCKEACVKALGGGYRLIQQVEIDLSTPTLPRLLRLAQDAPEAWSLHLITGLSGYAAALLVKQNQVVYKIYNAVD
jgi:4'-phosphopantetheinyl transferase